MNHLKKAFKIKQFKLTAFQIESFQIDPNSFKYMKFWLILSGIRILINFPANWIIFGEELNWSFLFVTFHGNHDPKICLTVSTRQRHSLMEQKWHDCRHWGYNGKCLEHQNERHIAIALWLDSWLVSPSTLLRFLDVYKLLLR